MYKIIRKSLKRGITSTLLLIYFSTLYFIVHIKNQPSFNEQRIQEQFSQDLFVERSTRIPLKSGFDSGSDQRNITVLELGKQQKKRKLNYDFQRGKELCHNFISFDSNTFVLMTDTVLDTKYCSGKKGGEKIEDVINQSEGSEFYTFQKGFFELFCPGLEQHYNNASKLKLWKHHFKDWIQAIHNFEDQRDFDKVLPNVTEDTLTIAVTRYEYANLFHTMTDWYNIFYIMKFFNQTTDDIKVLLIDGHPEGHLNSSWTTLFHSVEFIGHQAKQKTKYSNLVWNIAGYKSEFSTKLLKGRPAPKELKEFSNFFLKAYGIEPSSHQQNIEKLNILFLWRRDYLAHPRQIKSFKKSKSTITRKIQNEAEILNAAQKSYPSHNVTGVQLDLIPMKEQLELIVRTDIIISMHGAGLTHITFMNSTSGLIELFPKYVKHRPHFQNLAKWKQMPYLSWSNGDQTNEFPNFKTKIPPKVIIDLLRSMIGDLAKRKKSWNRIEEEVKLLSF